MQYGQDRAGFYSNEYLENLFGADVHNADEIKPEWQQRMLRGIKERAEGRPLVPAWLALIARIGWVLLGVGVAGVLLPRRRWIPIGLLCAALVVPPLWSTGDINSALAGFLALGISVLGLLAYPPVAATVLLVLLLAPDS